jgi:hypothetical protein
MKFFMPYGRLPQDREFWGMMMTDRGMMRNIAILAGASLLLLFSHFMNDSYLAAMKGVAVPKISILISFFYWLAYFSLSLVCLLPPAIIRYFLPGRELEGGWAVSGAFVNGGTIIMIMALPWQLFTGKIESGILYFLISRLVRIIVSLMIIYCGYSIVTKPDAEDEFAPPIDNATKCMLKFGEFKDFTKRRLGMQANAKTDRLWQMVYSYLKNDELITDAVKRGMPIDSIVMNAVGAVAYKLIESGMFHVARGALSPDGKYIADVWKLAADELVNRSYNTPDDMARGLALLEEAIGRAGGD